MRGSALAVSRGRLRTGDQAATSKGRNCRRFLNGAGGRTTAKCPSGIGKRQPDCLRSTHKSPDVNEPLYVWVRIAIKIRNSASCAKMANERIVGRMKTPNLQSPRNRIGVALCLVALSLGARGWGQIIPADRRYNWVPNVTVGVPGGIPIRTTIFTNLSNIDNTGASDVSVAINKAILACPENQVVYLPEGVYRSIRPSVRYTANTGLACAVPGPGRQH